MRDPYYTERDLPHYTPNDRPYFITFNLHGSIPAHQRIAYFKSFMEYESLLHMAEGPHYLKDARASQIVFDKLKWLESEVAQLQAFTIMSNHVHLVMTLHADQSLSRLMQLVKGGSSFSCNKVLGRSGRFWQDERFDHVLRQNEFWRTIRYVLMNPVRAKVVSQWSDYPWTYVDPGILEDLIKYRGGVE